MSAKLNLKYSTSVDQYSDGDSELELLRIFKSNNKQKIINNLLSNRPTWPFIYHLSPDRENLLSWYEFNPKNSLLEIGAGCGALTGLFCSKLNHVTAIELTKLRSQIIFERHKKYSNLNIITGNLSDIKIKDKYDYVTFIGVLEYAGKYTKSCDPYLNFLNLAKSYLKPKGTLIIAIENKFGLKYWAGCKEDHTGRYFDSIENYPNYSGIRTFGKNEITDLLINVGLKKIDFFYPLPDYKLPTEIFSEQYQPTQIHNLNSGIFPYIDFSQNREYVFNEKLAMDNIIQNNQFSFFANSFLIFAKQ